MQVLWNPVRSHKGLKREAFQVHFAFINTFNNQQCLKVALQKCISSGYKL